jgi:site-specific DNA recombinase
MKAIGYVRVSSEEQADKGISLEAQQAKIRAWADLNGYDQIEVYSDPGVSGKALVNREGVQAALKAVQQRDALVVYSLSRLSRRTRDALDVAEELEKKGADLVSLSERIDTTTAAGKMVFRMLAVLAEFERDQIAERTRAALAHLKAKGEFVGAVPYGCRLGENGRTLECDPVEHEVVVTARKLKSSGMSLRGIAQALSTSGYMTRTGRDFAPMQIKRMVETAA